MKAKMFQSRFFVIALLVLAGLWIPWLALARWPGDPNVNVPICTAPDKQEVPSLISDGSGGAIITWTDWRNVLADIYAQRVDADGTVLWTADGVPICTAPDTQWYPEIASDGAGGAIIVWEDYRTGHSNRDIYAQRVDADGTVLWIADGVPICTALNGQGYPAIVSDGTGGGIIAWRDERHDIFADDLYAQRVDADGTVLWTADGVPICTASNDQLQSGVGTTPGCISAVCSARHRDFGD